MEAEVFVNPKLEYSRSKSTIRVVDTAHIEIGGKFSKPIVIGIAEWQRLMNFRKALVKTWTPEKSPLPDDRMSHHFGTIFTDYGMSYYVSKIHRRGSIELQLYGAIIMVGFPDIVIPLRSINIINKQIEDMVNSKLTSLKELYNAR